MEILRTSSRQPSSDPAIAKIEYVGQGRYRKKAVTTAGATGPKNNNPLEISGCFNCDDPSHMTKDCP